MTFHVYIVYLYYMRPLKITQSITQRENESFNKYLKDVNGLDLINKEQEIELANRIKLGDHSAIDQLVKANLRFVISVAKQYTGRGMDIEDLVSEGNIGLIKAAQKFDPTKDIKFISYAVWWIRQSILQSLADNSRTIRLPLNQINALNKIKECQIRLEQELNRVPDSLELSEALGIDQSKIELSLKSNRYITSLDSPVLNDEDSLTLLDVVASDQSSDYIVENESLIQDIKSKLDRLTDKEKLVIEWSFGLNGKSEVSLSEIGQMIGVGKERVRQIKLKALSKMK